MKNSAIAALALSLCGALVPAAGAEAAQAPLTGFPFADEALNYTVMAPGGLTLGSARLNAKRSTAGWSFELAIEAGITGFTVQDRYTSQANPDFCSLSFTKQFIHGPRLGNETETVERSTETASRATPNGGGKSEFAVPDCVKDALTLLYYARRELGQGRVAPAQSVLFGGFYDARLDYAGAQTIAIAGKPVITDKIVCNLKGPASGIQFEIYFARDAARTPLRFEVPIGPARFSMELVR